MTNKRKEKEKERKRKRKRKESWSKICIYCITEFLNIL